MAAEVRWLEVGLFEQERLRAEVWLNTNAWGYEWRVLHCERGEWHTLDGGLERSMRGALHCAQRVIGEIAG